MSSWACEVCTYVNSDALLSCGMCETTRLRTTKKPRHVSPRAQADPVPQVDLSADALFAELEQEERDGAVNASSGAGQSVVCLVCRADVTVYIVLPSCAAEHSYCISCATKLMKQVPPKEQRGRSHARRSRAGGPDDVPGITCSLCAVRSDVPDLQKLRRFAVTHWDKEHTHYCETCHCGTSATSPQHATHTRVPVAVMAQRVRQSLEGELGMLEQKKQKLLAQVEVVRAQRDAIAGREKQLQDEWARGVADLRALLEQKEKEVSQALAKMAESKRAALLSELARLDDNLSAVDACMSSCAVMVALEHDAAQLMDAHVSARNRQTQAANCAVVRVEALAMAAHFPPLPHRFAVAALSRLQYAQQSPQHSAMMMMLMDEDAADGESGGAGGGGDGGAGAGGIYIPSLPPLAPMKKISVAAVSPADGEGEKLIKSSKPQLMALLSAFSGGPVGVFDDDEDVEMDEDEDEEDYV